MRAAFTRIKIFFLSSMIVCVTACEDKNLNAGATPEIAKTIATPDTLKSKHSYSNLRKTALLATSDELGLELPVNETVVFGIVMDWEVGNAIATTVAYMTGDASLYLSNGSGVIGGAQHQNVNSAAKQFVGEAQTFLDKCVKSETQDLPGTDEIKFYLLTNKGIYMGREQMVNFKNESSAWAKLFEQGNNVLTELRKISEQKR